MLVLEDNEMNPEEYSLSVSQQSAVIKANTATGKLHQDWGYDTKK